MSKPGDAWDHSRQRKVKRARKEEYILFKESDVYADMFFLTPQALEEKMDDKHVQQGFSLFDVLFSPIQKTSAEYNVLDHAVYKEGQKELRKKIDNFRSNSRVQQYAKTPVPPLKIGSKSKEREMFLDEFVQEERGLLEIAQLIPDGIQGEVLLKDEAKVSLARLTWLVKVVYLNDGDKMVSNVYRRNLSRNVDKRKAKRQWKDIWLIVLQSRSEALVSVIDGFEGGLKALLKEDVDWAHPVVHVLRFFEILRWHFDEGLLDRLNFIEWIVQKLETVVENVGKMLSSVLLVWVPLVVRFRKEIGQVKSLDLKCKSVLSALKLFLETKGVLEKFKQLSNAFDRVLGKQSDGHIVPCEFNDFGIADILHCEDEFEMALERLFPFFLDHSTDTGIKRESFQFAIYLGIKDEHVATKVSDLLSYISRTFSNASHRKCQRDLLLTTIAVYPFQNEEEIAHCAVLLNLLQRNGLFSVLSLMRKICASPSSSPQKMLLLKLLCRIEFENNVMSQRQHRRLVTELTSVEQSVSAVIGAISPFVGDEMKNQIVDHFERCFDMSFSTRPFHHNDVILCCVLKRIIGVVQVSLSNHAFVCCCIRLVEVSGYKNILMDLLILLMKNNSTNMMLVFALERHYSVFRWNKTFLSYFQIWAQHFNFSIGNSENDEELAQILSENSKSTVNAFLSGETSASSLSKTNCQLQSISYAIEKASTTNVTAVAEYCRIVMSLRFFNVKAVLNLILLSIRTLIDENCPIILNLVLHLIEIGTLSLESVIHCVLPLINSSPTAMKVLVSLLFPKEHYEMSVSMKSALAMEISICSRAVIRAVKALLGERALDVSTLYEHPMVSRCVQKEFAFDPMEYLKETGNELEMKNLELILESSSVFQLSNVFHVVDHFNGRNLSNYLITALETALTTGDTLKVHILQRVVGRLRDDAAVSVIDSIASLLDSNPSICVIELYHTLTFTRIDPIPSNISTKVLKTVTRILQSPVQHVSLCSFYGSLKFLNWALDHTETHTEIQSLLDIVFDYLKSPHSIDPINIQCHSSTHRQIDVLLLALQNLEKLIHRFSSISTEQQLGDKMWDFYMQLEKSEIPLFLKHKVMTFLPTVSLGIEEFGEWERNWMKIPPDDTSSFVKDMDPWNLLEHVYGNPLALHLHRKSSTV